MRILLFGIVLLNLLACFNQKNKASKQTTATDSIPVKVHSQLNAKKIELIETVLNLPDVIRFSKLEFIRKKYDEVYILLEGIEDTGSIPSIRQSGKSLAVVYSMDSIIQNKPCYVFDKIEIQGDSAYVRMTFDITGAIAFGNLKYTGRHWVPDKNFMVGVR